MSQSVKLTNIPFNVTRENSELRPQKQDRRVKIKITEEEKEGCQNI